MVKQLIKTTLAEFSEDEIPQMAAALAYYTVFSLPPIIFLLITLVGLFVDPRDVQGRLQNEIAALIGPQGAQTLESAVQNASRAETGGVIGTVVSIFVLLLGATGAFSQLQTAINRAWEVEQDPEQKAVRKYLMMAVKRLFSLGMIVVIAFLLLVSLVISTALSVLSTRLDLLLPGGIGGFLLQVVNFAISLGVITLLFAAMYKVLPDARIAWKDVWLGAFVTAVLFTIGKFLLGFYIGQSNPGEAYGAAGSLAVILVWVYYSAIIVLLGAEFTQVWARRKAPSIQPAAGAVRVVEEKKYIRGHEEGHSPNVPPHEELARETRAANLPSKNRTAS